MARDRLFGNSLYREYRRRLDPLAVLHHYGMENDHEQTNADGTTEVIHSCLLDKVERHHANGDQNPSASANLDKKLYVCYNYWGGDLFHFIAKMERKEHFADIVTVVGAFLSGATLGGQDFVDELNAMLLAPDAYSQDIPAYSDRVLVPWLGLHPYWASRGISDQAVHDLRLGFDPVEGRVVFPHYVDGNLVGWQKRLTPAAVPQYPKYRNSLNFPKSETLYNLDRARAFRSVVVVESPMSVARAYSLGIPNFVATFGAKVSARQIELLKDFDHVYIWFDDDAAGRYGERKLLSGLYHRTQVSVVVPDSGRDAGDSLSDREIVEKVFGSVPAALRLADHDLMKN